jgi:hypothetical protein
MRMSVLVNAVIVAALWLISNFISQWLLGSTGCTYSVTVLFSWWVVAYFTKHININPVTLFVTYIVLIAFIMSAHYAGYYQRFFPNVPNMWSDNWWISFMILAFVMVTPLIFNLIVRYITKAISHVA